MLRQLTRYRCERDRSINDCANLGYALSERCRKKVEQPSGWMKTVGLLRKLRHRGGRKVDWIVSFTAAEYQPGNDGGRLPRGPRDDEAKRWSTMDHQKRTNHHR